MKMFEALAFAVFRYQFDTLRPYRRYCEQRGVESILGRRIVDSPGGQQCRVQVCRSLRLMAQASLPDAVGFSHQRDDQGRGRRGRHIVAVAGNLSGIGTRSSCAQCCSPMRARMAMLALHPTCGRDAGIVAGAMIAGASRSSATRKRSAQPRANGSTWLRQLVSCGSRSKSRTCLPVGDDGGVRGRCFPSCASRREIQARERFAHDGYRWREGTGNADARHEVIARQTNGLRSRRRWSSTNTG